jgi:indolepyruvate ferredoxin oxidoreductase
MASRRAWSALADARRADNATELAARLPYFCSGCPHNTSTKVPEGSRAYAGSAATTWCSGWTVRPSASPIWAARARTGSARRRFPPAITCSRTWATAPITIRAMQAIRAALAAGTNITYKILFNDAVAMTGGQGNEGGLTASGSWRELLAMGVRTSPWSTTKRKTIWTCRTFPPGVERHERADLMRVQERYAKIKGVSAIVYVQTCAAEKRRRRKRGKFPDPDKRCSSTPMSAKAAAIAGCSRTACPSCRWKPNWAASARSTSRPATRISAASRASARPS